MTYDFHTHNPHLRPGAGILCLDAATLMSPDFVPVPQMHYSAGIHPWWVAGMSDAEVAAMVARIDALLDLPGFVMVGECGIDRICAAQGSLPPSMPSKSIVRSVGKGTDIEQLLVRQAEVFRQMVELSERHALPMTIHCVRAFDILLHLHRQWRPTQTWTVHGFRGKPALARQLLDAGLDLSFGTHYNPESFALTPPHRRHRETDADPAGQLDAPTPNPLTPNL